MSTGNNSRKLASDDPVFGFISGHSSYRITLIAGVIRLEQKVREPDVWLMVKAETANEEAMMYGLQRMLERLINNAKIIDFQGRRLKELGEKKAEPLFTEPPQFETKEQRAKREKADRQRIYNREYAKRRRADPEFLKKCSEAAARWRENHPDRYAAVVAGQATGKPRGRPRKA